MGEEEGEVGAEGGVDGGAIGEEFGEEGGVVGPPALGRAGQREGVGLRGAAGDGGGRRGARKKARVFQRDTTINILNYRIGCRID